MQYALVPHPISMIPCLPHVLIELLSGFDLLLQGITLSEVICPSHFLTECLEPCNDIHLLEGVLKYNFYPGSECLF